MRYVYIDESGTSAKESVAVVAAVILRADAQWRDAENYLEYLRAAHLPPGAPKGFVFHAMHLLPRTPDDHQVHGIDMPMSPRSRFRLLERLVAAPRRLGFPVVYGYCRRRDDVDPALEPTMRHVQAFQLCLMRSAHVIADEFPGEIATVVAENVTHMKKHLKKVLGFLKDDSAKPGLFCGTPAHVLVDLVHFTEKDGAPLLQYADAAAFALRSHISNQRHGKRLLGALAPNGWPASWGFGGHGVMRRDFHIS